MLRPRLACPLTLALIGVLLASGSAHAQVIYAPVPPPPPRVVVPAPAPYRVYPRPYYRPAPMPAPVAVYNPIRDERRAHDWMLARVYTGVGTTALVLGFFSLMAGIPVLVLTSTHDLCRPSSTNSCDGYYGLGWGLIGGGIASMAAGTALDIVGSVYRFRARYASADLLGPRVALLPSTDGKIGGAALALSVRF